MGVPKACPTPTNLGFETRMDLLPEEESFVQVTASCTYFLKAN